MATAALHQDIEARDGQVYHLRPIRRSDAPSLMRGYDALSERAKWFRMLHAQPHLSAQMALDYCTPPEDEVCLVFEGHGALQGELLGGARIAGLGPGRMAEYSVSLRPEARGLGLARASLEAVIEVARARGCAGVIGLVARRNHAMRGLAKRLGMKEVIDADDPSLVVTDLRFEA